MEDGTNRFRLTSTSVRAGPIPRRSRKLPAPKLLLFDALAGVRVARTAGKEFTRSARLVGADALISSRPHTVVGVGAVHPLRATRDPVTTIVLSALLLLASAGSLAGSDDGSAAAHGSCFRAALRAVNGNTQTDAEHM